MLEPVGLVVDRVEAELERSRQVELEQAVMTEHLERDPLAAPREAHPSVRLVVDEAARRELLHHRGRGGRADPHLPRQRRRLDARPPGLELVDLPQVVLERVADVGEAGHDQATSSPVTYMTTIPAR